VEFNHKTSNAGIRLIVVQVAKNKEYDSVWGIISSKASFRGSYFSTSGWEGCWQPYLFSSHPHQCYSRSQQDDAAET